MSLKRAFEEAAKKLSTLKKAVIKKMFYICSDNLGLFG